MRKNKSRRGWIFVLIIAVIVAGAIVARNRNNNKSEPAIKTGKVARGNVTTTVSATGILQPLTTVEVKSNVGGSVVFLGVDEGDRVKAGQVIARIDPADSQTNLEQSQADLDGSRARVAQAQENLAMQRRQTVAQIASAEQAVETAKLRLSQAEKQAVLQTTTSVTAIEQAQQGLESARARLEQAEEQARIQPKLTASAITQAKSNLTAAKAAYQQAKTATVPQMLAGAQASYNQAKANYDYAGKNLERQKGLLAKGFVARSQVDAAEQSFQVAQAQLDTAKNKLETVKDETQQNLDSAQAKIDQAQAALENAEANSMQDKLKQQDVLAARASVKQAEASLRSAQANKAQDSLKQDDVAAARASLKQAQSSLDTARASAYQIGMKQKDITQALAQMKRSEATVSNARTQLSYTTIVAPRDGIVMKKYIDPGSIVTAGRSSIGGTGAGVALIDLADISRMFVLVNVDETDIASISLGQEVDVTIDAYTNKLFTGRVTKIAPQTVTEQNVTTVPVTVEIETPDQRLKPGMNATCDFITGRRKDVLIVPNSAITEGDNRRITVTVIENGKQVARRVEAGLADNDHTEIISGLKEGEEIVMQTVKPQNGNGQNNDRRRRMRGPF
ncbi:MAG: efflux RND transporter periplasmic adaptor subunit [Armatimonadota bacterium]